MKDKSTYTDWCNRRDIPIHLRSEQYFITKYNKEIGVANAD